VSKSIPEICFSLYRLEVAIIHVCDLTLVTQHYIMSGGVCNHFIMVASIKGLKSTL